MSEILSATFPLIAPLVKQQFEFWRMEQKRTAVFFTGVYLVKTSIPTQRKTGCDNEGILYIGKGNVLGENNRLLDLGDAFNGAGVKHIAGILYNGRRYVDLYPLDTLSLYVEITNNYRLLAKHKFESYQQKYGELPLLN